MKQQILEKRVKDLQAALEWFIENDDTNNTVGNEFWIEGLERGRKALAESREEPYKRLDWVTDKDT